MELVVDTDEDIVDTEDDIADTDDIDDQDGTEDQDVIDDQDEQAATEDIYLAHTHRPMQEGQESHRAH